MVRQFDCPSCGTPVKIRKGASSVICKYCGSSVVVPAHLAGFNGSSSVAPAQGSSFGKTAVILIMTGVSLVIGIGAFVFCLTGTDGKRVSQAIDDVAVPYESGAELVTMEFGGPGTGSGCFQRPKCITVDGSGNIFVGEWDTSRIQVFDRNGCFINQWSFADKEEKFLSAMSCSRNGILYMVYNGEIYVHNGETGELIDSLQHPDGWGFEDVDVAQDGSVLASWYCNRDDIIRFDSHGAIDLIIEEAVSGRTGHSELSMMVAVGNLGEIYAFGFFNEAVFIFNRLGRFQDRFGNGDLFFIPSGIDIDTQGRLWMSDFGNLLIFDSSGELISTIDPGVSVSDFVISDDMQLFGITDDETVVQIDLSNF